MSYCEYYHCCKTRPCRLFDPGTAPGVDVYFQNSHDEFLRYADKEIEPPLPVSNLIKHLIQFRYPIPSTISNFRLAQERQWQDSKNNGTGDPQAAHLDWLP